MNLPGVSQLLEAWDQAEPQSAVERPVALLAALWSGPAEGDWERLPLGRRDAHLLALWEQVFGPNLPCLADCPRCGEAVEFELPAGRMRLEAPSVEGALALEQDGWRVTFRLPDTTDLAAATAEPDVSSGRRRLLARCLVSAAGPDNPAAAVGDLPEGLTSAIAQRMGEADPQADVAFDLTCPHCRQIWEAPFDVGAHFWAQLDAWARRLLGDVHQLASAYGWSETEILRLSTTRRQAYLDLVRA